MLNAGDKAPDFTLKDQDGKEHSLSDYKGKRVLLYFYPKDDTPGCTMEACEMRDGKAAMARAGVVVLGVSGDKVRSHAKFAEKFKLNFPILADEEKETIKAYGAWAKKKFMGREYMGILRVSYLIGPDGKIEKAYAKVKPGTHAAEVLADAKARRHCS